MAQIVALDDAVAYIEPVEPSSPSRPLTARQRVRWVINGTIGPQSLATGVLSSAVGTAIDKPTEYGPSWDGFGKRYAMRLTGVATSHALEAGLGSLWNEDPRYFPAADRSVKGRVNNIFILTVAARRTDGSLAPAYARYVATLGSNFVSNAWRANGDATSSDALERTVWGLLGRAAGNAFSEFWPDIRRHAFHRK
jgi:hypothetical protein